MKILQTFRLRRFEGYRYLLPGLLVLLAISLIPIGIMVYVSMTDFEMGKVWSEREMVGLENYAWLLRGEDYRFYPALFLTLKYVFVVVSVSFVMGMAIALILNHPLMMRQIVIVFLLAPIVTSTPVVGLSWRLMFHTQNGIINYLLSLAGIAPVNWLGEKWAFFSVVVATLWRSGCFMGLVLTAGLQTIPSEPIEAAHVDGATGIQAFWHITMPLLRPIILVVVLLQSIASIQQFGLIFIMTGGGPGGVTELLSLHLYRQALSFSSFIGRGSAIAIILAGISVGLSSILIVLIKRRQEE